MTVCVVGDSEETLKEAAVLERFANTVYLITPLKAPTFPSEDPLFSSDKVHVMSGSRVTSIHGTDVVSGIKVQNVENGEGQEIPIDGVFIYLVGSRPVVEFLNESVPLSENACVLTHRTMETSIPGVFAAGDVSCGEVRQVVVAASYGCIAALSAEKYIHQRKRARFDWSKS
jgi:thioredoxin reductase (NADPH)